MNPAPFLSHLNPSQRHAVEHFCGPLLVVAGAGSGKTRALTYRIAHLIRHHRVDPENILAVTFTNKAAKEMKERIEKLFSQQAALDEYGIPLSLVPEADQMRLRSRIYKTYIRDLWVGTFHALCARMLRFDIDKYKSPQGNTWTKQFSIFDESDAQSLIKDIVTQQMNLDSKKFEPRSVRFAISNAKNRGLTPQELEEDQPNYRGRVIADVYRRYGDKLAENNAVDFDDLLLIPVKLFEQNESILGYWHRRFRHVLVDEYQDTNRTQYDLIRLLVTNGENPGSWPLGGPQWHQRSVFVVGDVDQSIYSFRAADFTILMEFQEDFGDGLPDGETRTMVKLEENYRSTENILEAANVLIQNNTERIDKVLRPTRGMGEPIICHSCDDEIMEARYVVERMRHLSQDNPELNWRSFAILYRTNAQSRPFEDVLVQWNIPYTVVGGLRFYDRREIRDMLAYLRLLVNPFDTVSLLRVINVPKRGIGKTTVDRLVMAAQELNLPLWEVLSDGGLVKTYGGRSVKGIQQFMEQLQQWQNDLEETSPAQMVQRVMEESGYRQDLMTQGTEEADDRLKNLGELQNAAQQFEEENEDPTLLNFLAGAALASDADSQQEEANRVSLMTLHSSKGLEFPVVFLVGLEQGLFPNYRSLGDPAALEEERRLCYVGITRAQEQLFLTHASARRLWGSRESATPSPFLAELPPELVQGLGTRTSRRSALEDSTDSSLSSRAQGSGDRPAGSRGSRSGTRSSKPQSPGSAGSAASGSSQRRREPSTHIWTVGDRLLHRSFGVGQVTHVFNQGKKVSIAVRFDNSIGQKVLDPTLAPLQPLP
jgi:DNA helicase II / ATP-dependent DNA helicase PcrA